MNKRNVGLVVLLLLIGLGYVLVFNARRVPPIEAMFVELPGSPPMFSFNDQLTLTEVKVVRPGVEPAEDEVYIPPVDEVVWHLIPREPQEGEDPIELRPTKVVKYGQGLRGLRRAEDTPRRGVPLEPGVKYLFSATLADGQGTIELEFTPKAKS